MPEGKHLWKRPEKSKVVAQKQAQGWQQLAGWLPAALMGTLSAEVLLKLGAWQGSCCDFGDVLSAIIAPLHGKAVARSDLSAALLSFQNASSEQKSRGRSLEAC